MFKNARWLWANSALVWEGKGAFVLTKRIRFMFKALGLYNAVKPFMEATQETPLGQLMGHRPETLGAIVWPYQCVGWDARTRLERIRKHYSTVERLNGPLNFSVGDKLELLDLNVIREGLHVVIDQPKWFMREGGLAINLFVGETRMFSLAFSLADENGSITAFIGAIQGRDIEGALDEYKEITKAAHGMRPRDLLIELFRMFCEAFGISKIFAVSDEHRHHRHPYFGKVPKDFSNNYNDIWAERGGLRVDPKFFELPTKSNQKDLETIPAKKRGMYRRRYEMLHALKAQMSVGHPRSELAAPE
jgi:uncharacterized protein VirK/YbjX